MELPEILLKLAAAAGGGVDALLRATAGVLREAAPFDAAEVAVSRPLGFERWTLTDDVSPIAGDDVLFHVIARREPLRLDDLHEMAVYPRTHERLGPLGLRSLLILPLNAAGGCEGAIVLARNFGWAFAGASLRTLWGVAGMTGLCLEQAISGGALGNETDVQRRRADHAQQALAAQTQKLLRLEQELATLRAALARRDSQGGAAGQQAPATEPVADAPAPDPGARLLPAESVRHATGGPRLWWTQHE